MSRVAQMEAVESAYRRTLPSFRVGDNVKVHYRIREGEKERVQIFEGVVIRRRGSGLSETFTVRKLSFGIGVERIYPLNTPRIERLEVTGHGHARRSRLYYLRDRAGKAARLRESGRQDTSDGASDGN